MRVNFFIAGIVKIVFLNRNFVNKHFDILFTYHQNWKHYICWNCFSRKKKLRINKIQLFKKMCKKRQLGKNPLQKLLLELLLFVNFNFWIIYRVFY